SGPIRFVARRLGGGGAPRRDERALPPGEGAAVMVKKELVVVIMAGGAGTRFWPLSTEARPKQFLALTGDRTLLQMSFDRVKDIVDADRVFVLTSAHYTELVARQ